MTAAEFGSTALIHVEEAASLSINTFVPLSQMSSVERQIISWYYRNNIIFRNIIEIILSLWNSERIMALPIL